MAVTLITGMSGTGKSSVVLRLVELGHRAVDLDTDEWCHLVPDDSEYADAGAAPAMDWRWRDDEVRQLLSSAQAQPAGAEPELFVAGTSTTQASYYPLLDHVVLLSVPEPVARLRLATRTTNDYGKQPAELQRELHHRAAVEPRLRRSACFEIDTSQSDVADVSAQILSHTHRSLACRS